MSAKACGAAGRAVEVLAGLLDLTMPTTLLARADEVIE
jgi:hypothetical protein